MPSVVKREVRLMSVMEVLTLMLVVIAVLSYLDNHINKKK